MDLLDRWVLSADRRARRRLGIRELSDDDRCIFRLALDEATRATALRDGTVLERGEPVGALHLAGERIPQLTSVGGDLAWGKSALAACFHSLRLLCAEAMTRPELLPIRAFGNDLTLPYRTGTLRVLDRVGFEVFDPVVRRGLRGRLSLLAAGLWTALLRRAQNPLSAQRLRLGDLETRPVWMSRSTLLARYGEAGGRSTSREGH